MVVVVMLRWLWWLRWCCTGFGGSVWWCCDGFGGGAVEVVVAVVLR